MAQVESAHKKVYPLFAWGRLILSSWEARTLHPFLDYMQRDPRESLGGNWFYNPKVYDLN